MKPFILIGGIILAAGGLAAFGIFSGRDSATVAHPVIQNISSKTANASAPDLTLQKLDGGTLSLSEFKGKKAVVLDFWASWCPNCRRDMPNLSRFYQAHKDAVEVIGVNLQESAATVRDFIASRSISFPIALDPYGRASGAFGIRYTNTHILIDKAGNLVRAIPGDIQESDIVSLAGSQ